MTSSSAKARSIHARPPGRPDPAARFGTFPPTAPLRSPTTAEAVEAYDRIRDVSRQITANLEPEDCVVQSMTDASPIRWHLAHTTWFFETFLLRKSVPEYRCCDPQFEYLFNSYYNTVGDQFPRSQRGLLSRPTMAQVWEYRTHVDREMKQWLARVHPEQWDDVAPVFQIGLQHEQQHQELMLTDIKHAFSMNPLFPSVRQSATLPTHASHCSEHPSNRSRDVFTIPSETTEHADLLNFVPFSGGIRQVGCDFTGGEGAIFCYDNESPRHDALLQPFELAERPITNREYFQFMRDGGYQESRHWLSAGWATVQERAWNAPLYWIEKGGQWCYFTLDGIAPIEWDAPVVHVSFYEADAYARWAGLRLPTEFEWEVAAESCWQNPLAYGSLQEDLESAPIAAHVDTGEPASRPTLRQMFGDVWEWTASPYVGYPGYRPPDGAIGEYNGKFMSNQMVLRGGSLATPYHHIRTSYRNFFPPDARWQFSGIRLAR